MSSLDLYKQICEELAKTSPQPDRYRYIKKGSIEYDQVMEIFNERKPKREYTDKEKKWNRALKELNYKYVKKGTPEYQAVLNLFKSY